MAWEFLPVAVGVAWIIVQSAYMMGRIDGKLRQIERRLDRLENLMNSQRKEG